jgi:DNA-binding NarL/FixJ family response regulator
VLAVSGHAEPSVEALAAVRAGAAGYVVRPRSAVDFVRAVRRTAAGEAVFSPGLADGVLAAHGPGAAHVSLTERETGVLRLVVEGLTARQIATRLVLSPRTVENHVQHILRKAGLSNRAALVRYAIEEGLV